MSKTCIQSTLFEEIKWDVNSMELHVICCIGRIDMSLKSNSCTFVPFYLITVCHIKLSIVGDFQIEFIFNQDNTLAHTAKM